MKPRRKTYTKPDTHTKTQHTVDNAKQVKEMGIPDYLICLLKNLYAGQEATVGPGHGK